VRRPAVTWPGWISTWRKPRRRLQRRATVLQRSETYLQ
jgi:hypothetical protein